MSEVYSLLRNGWENIWKNKILWGFSFLTLLEPITQLVVPNERSSDLPIILFNLAVSITSFYLFFISDAGISYVSYCIAINQPVNVQTAYQASKKLFWRVVGLTLVLFLIVSPCICIVYLFSFEQPLYFSRNIFLISIPMSVFSAVLYFAVTETIANDSKIGKSLKAAWTVFTYYFASLATIGFLLAIASYIVNVFIGATIMFVQNGFDFMSLSKLDFISPYLSFTENNFYELATTIISNVWRIYSTSVFTVAYLKYNEVNNQPPTSTKRAPLFLDL